MPTDIDTHTEDKTQIDTPVLISLISNIDNNTVTPVRNPDILPGITGTPQIEIPVLSESGSEPEPELGFEGEDGGSKKHLNIKAAIIAADALSLILDVDSLPSSLPSFPPLISSLPLISSFTFQGV